MSDDVDAWLHYRADQGGRSPEAIYYWGGAEFRWPDLLYRLDGLVYIATGELLGIREDATHRYQASQGYSPPCKGVSPWGGVSLHLKEVIPQSSGAGAIGIGSGSLNRAGRSTSACSPFAPTRSLIGFYMRWKAGVAGSRRRAGEIGMVVAFSHRDAPS